MKIIVVSVDHGDQVVPLSDEERIRETMNRKQKVRTLVQEKIATRKVDLICEESDPCHLSIAQKEAFEHQPRIPWKNITMTSQERLDAGIWEALRDRPYELEPVDEFHALKIEYRIPEDDVREGFFKNEILKSAKENGAESILVLCGDMHTEALGKKLEQVGHDVETNHELTPKKNWRVA